MATGTTGPMSTVATALVLTAFPERASVPDAPRSKRTSPADAAEYVQVNTTCCPAGTSAGAAGAETGVTRPPGEIAIEGWTPSASTIPGLFRVSERVMVSPGIAPGATETDGTSRATASKMITVH